MSGSKLKKITPRQAYAFSRLVQKRSLDDDASKLARQSLRDAELGRLAKEVIRFRDDEDLSEASAGARVLIETLRAE